MPSERVERRLSAIFAGDVVGYSRLMEADEEGTLARLNAHRREFLDPTIAQNRGRIVKRTGDGVLIEFISAVDAARCAVEIQRGMGERNAGVPPFPDSHGILAAAAAHLEHTADAQAGLKGFVQLLPGLTLRDSRLIRPFRRPADRERFRTGLRKAGLPSE